ncbi:hypothetical protein [Solibacillus daqui]|uniref:hypothetical protein n=1 Tax=Solibacillus daqui TaxID=2912187 RepID=UPI0023662E0C|nr:hypothetical protein [Solibacillus daqui]
MKIIPSAENLTAWIENYVPRRDLFFISGELYHKQIDFSQVLVMPIEEFYTHSTYSQIDFTNSYEYWNIKYVNYVIVANCQWIEQIPTEQKQMLLQAQVQCERGLVVPVSFIDNLEEIPKDYIHNNQVVFQRAMWDTLSWKTKEQILKTMVSQWWDNGECEQAPASLPQHLKPFTNVFSHQQGANCLAAVLYAISNGKQQWIIHEWVHQKTFLEKLALSQYEIVDSEELITGDVLAWLDDIGTIQHAAYYIGDNLFFNKHGQTIFNPWKLLATDALEKEWGSLKKVTYRKMV